jgi:hypothetical protein
MINSGVNYSTYQCRSYKHHIFRCILCLIILQEPSYDKLNLETKYSIIFTLFQFIILKIKNNIIDLEI